VNPVPLVLLSCALAVQDPPVDGEEGVTNHWAYTPPKRHAQPDVSHGDWPRDSLDEFVLERLEQQALNPASQAPRWQWLRRVSLDLTGLPPTPDEVDAFSADVADGAHERVVDRLLASPRYGEHMASGWLDLARYADTYGYQSDVYREVWPWRDWVIEAFNQNLPYDEFLTWQLAGDLLPDATREQRLATAFNRLHRQTNEGGSTEEEYRQEYVADRVNTFGTAFLGMTFECARCHDHKFDPIRQSEYYSLASFFSSIDESGLYSHFTSAVPTPALELPTDDQRRDLALAQERVRALEKKPLSSRPAFDLRVPRPGPLGIWSMDEQEGQVLANQLEGAPAGSLGGGNRRVPSYKGRGLELTGDDPVTFPDVGHFRRWDAFTLSLWVRLPKHYERAVILHRSKAWHDSGSRGYQWLVEDGRFSASLIHFWPGDALRVCTAETLPVGKWVHLAMTYDGSSRAAGMHLYVNGRSVAVDVIRDQLTRSIVGSSEKDLTLGERFRDRGLAGGQVDELVVFDRVLGAQEVAGLFREVFPVDAIQRTEEDWDSLPSDIQRRADLRLARKERDELRDRVRQIMTMEETSEQRVVHRNDRGRYDLPKEIVTRGVPQALGALPRAETRPDRLTLARWLTRPGHPLTSRVAVNRIWQGLFGRGLVATSEDFGVQGTAPSHPELLDNLALDFVESGWDVKAMQRRIVLSATYRQSSRATEASRVSDPDGALLSRFPVHRLRAEALRDGALLRAGLLVEQVGGPSVKPYQPAGLWKEKSGAAYQPDTGDGLYRRSLYTIWKRTSPPPSMMILDAAKRDVCVTRRQSTNTPLQALVLFNDPQLVEAARVLAEQILADPGDPHGQLNRLFRIVMTREPQGEELSALMELWMDVLTHYVEDPLAAEALVAVGARDPNPDLDPAEVAAWTLLASALLTTDEALTLR